MARRTAPVRPAVLLAVPLSAILLLAGCSSDDEVDSKDSTTTSAEDTTSTTTSSTTTAPGSSTSSIPEQVPGAELPDGDMVGYLRAIDLGENTVTVDLASALSGAEAAAAYQEDQGTPLDGEQFYVRNQDPTTHVASIDPTGTFGVIYASSCCEPTSVPIEGLAEAIGGDWQGITRPNPPFNITVEGGIVTAAVQMHLP